MTPHQRLQALTYGVLLALIVGWVLHVGRSVFVPIVFAVVLVYVIVGLTRLLARIPGIGSRLSLRARYALSALAAIAASALIAFVALDNLDRLAAQSGQYQGALLATIQHLAVRFGVENEPTWATLRQLFLDQVSIQSLVGSAMLAATSILSTVIVVLLYVVFLLAEQRWLNDKIERVSESARTVALIRQIIASTNARIGSYFALKALLGLLMAVLSFAIMRYYKLEFAAFWAMLVLLLNFVPYLGSIISVFFPAAMAVVQFTDTGTIVTLVLALIAVQFVIGNFLDPYLLGNSLNLSPFSILASLAVWTALWGAPGALLAVPITAIMTIVFSEFAGTRPIAVLLSRTGELDEDTRKTT